MALAEVVDAAQEQAVDKEEAGDEFSDESCHHSKRRIR